MGKNRGFLKAVFAASVGAAVIAGGYWAFSEARYGHKIKDAGICKEVVTETAQINIQTLPMRPAADFYKSPVAEERQFMLFGDTDHSDYRIGDYFYSAAHLDILAQAGIRHIFIERAPGSQKGLDDLVAGKITPEEFSSQYEGGKMWDREGAAQSRIHMAKGVIYAAGKGMAVHAIDVKTTGIATKKEREELYAFYGDMSASFNTACPGADHMTDAFYEAYQQRRYFYLMQKEKRFAEIMQERSNDENRVALMRKIAGGERSAVLFGAAHYSGPKSMKTLLGKGSSLHINFFPDQDKMQQYGPGISAADFSHVINAGRIYQTGSLAFVDALALRARGLAP